MFISLTIESLRHPGSGLRVRVIYTYAYPFKKSKIFRREKTDQRIVTYIYIYIASLGTYNVE